MIVCTQCGASSEDGDDFCGTCGAFLEWEGERVEVAVAAPLVAPQVEVDEGRPGIIERVKTAVGMDEVSVAARQAEADAADSARAEEEARQAAEAARAAEEAAQRAEAEARQAEEEAGQAAEAEAARQAAAAVEEVRRASEAEAARKAAAAAEAARRAEAEAGRRAESQAEAARRAAAEAEAARRAEEARDAEEAARAAEAAGEAQAVEQARAAAARAQAERARAEERARVEAEEQARAEAERQAEQARAETERQAAEVAAEAERVAAERAETERQAAAERARVDAAAKAEAAARARAEAGARAEAARRAAAMVAKPRPAVVAEPLVATGDAAPAAVAGAAAATAAVTAAATAAGPTAAQPTAQQPAAQKPAVVRRPPPPKGPTRPSRPIKPGDLICGQCGEGNDPDRKFCRRCGSSLAEAIQVKIPWWRKLLNLFKRKKKVLAAGERPMRGTSGDRRGRRGVGKRLRIGFKRILPVIIILGVVLSFFGPFKQTIRDKLNPITSKISRTIKPSYAPVHPTGATASSEAPGHTAVMAVDGIKNNFWAEGAPGKGEGQGLIITFEKPTNLDQIGFTLGASTKPEDFQTQPRPHELHLVYTDGSSDDVSLKDTADFQKVKVKAKNVTTVQMQITSVYGSLQGDACSIAEIEFFYKR